MRLENKVAIITGSGSGFGAGIARRLAENGCRVVINDINEPMGKDVVETLNADFGEGTAAFHAADVSRRDQMKDLVDFASKQFARVDIFVNNAGVSNRNMSTLDIQEEDFDRIFNVNVRAIWLSACEMVPVLRQQGGGGSIINVASTGALRPRPGLVLYNASKAAVVNMTKSMAVEFAADNIRINALCPVAGDTPLLATFMGDDTKELRESFASTIPLGRLSTPDDIGNAALFLSSDEAAFITGVALEVDGGRCV